MIDSSAQFCGPQPAAPESLATHEHKYKPRAWESYSMYELGSFVHLLAKRAEHREAMDKRLKDLEDAQNYLNMMQAKLDALKPK